MGDKALYKTLALIMNFNYTTWSLPSSHRWLAEMQTLVKTGAIQG